MNRPDDSPTDPTAPTLAREARRPHDAPVAPRLATAATLRARRRGSRAHRSRFLTSVSAQEALPRRGADVVRADRTADGSSEHPAAPAGRVRAGSVRGGRGAHVPD